MDDALPDMLMRKFLYILLLFGSAEASLYAQQTPLMSQFHVAPFVYNPSLAGSKGNTRITLITRQQWVGYESYPGTYWVSLEGRFVKRSYRLRNFIGMKTFKSRRDKSRVGMGGGLSSDRNGLLQQTSLNLAYAYHLFLQRTQFSMGLQASFSQLSVDENNIQVVDVDDPKLGQIRQNQFYPDFNLGISLLHLRFEAGFSVVSVLQTPLKLGNTQLQYTLFRHYYAYGAYHQPVYRKMTFSPFVLGVVANGTYYLDLMAGFTWGNQYHIHLAYRNQRDLIVQGGVTIPELIMSNELYIGYAFDYPAFSAIRPNNLGAHELIIRMGIGSGNRRDRWYDRY